MILKRFIEHGSTPARRRFWESARQAVIASQKIAGRQVSVDEHPGKGTIVNVIGNRNRPARPSGGCPVSGSDCTAVISGISFPCGCIDLGPFGFPGSSISLDDSGVNMTTGLGEAPGPPEFWLASPVSPFIVHSYTDDHCGHLYFDSTVNQILFVACVESSFTILLYDSLDLFATFYATGAAVGTAASNTLTCGQIVPTPLLPPFGGPSGVLGVATGGTILVTQP